jgi:hypothetical protein
MLNVPLGSVSAYQNDPQWGVFNVVGFSSTANVKVTAGGLSASLTSLQLTTVTNLTVTGSIDASDFVTMRDNMPALAVLDISGATIAAYTGTGGTYTDTSYPDNTVPEYAFYNSGTRTGKSTLTSITFPGSVTSIGITAFSMCSGLTTLTLPNSLTSIGSNAFFYCSGLTSITMPNAVNTIGDMAFGYCTRLTSITIPTSLTSIEDGVFYGCIGLTSITIPNSVTSTGQNAFKVGSKNSFFSLSHITN